MKAVVFSFSSNIATLKTLYEMQATNEGLLNISLDRMNAFNDDLLKRQDDELRRSAFAFLSVFSNTDVFDVRLEPDSLYEWSISRTAKDRLLKQLRTKEACFFFEGSYVVLFAISFHFLFYFTSPVASVEATL